MKKLLLSAVALLGFGLAAEAQTLSVADNEFVALKGESNTLTINVGSATQVRDVQFDITVPAGVTIGTPAAGESTYSVAMSDAVDVNGDNKYTVILYSASAATGACSIDFPLTIADGVTPWAQVSSSTANGKWTNVSAVEAAATSTAYTFEIGLKGDVSKDAKVNSTDVSGMLQYIADGRVPADLGAMAVVANINGDAQLNSTDVSGILQIVAATSSEVKAEVDFVEIPADVEVDWAD